MKRILFIALAAIVLAACNTEGPKTVEINGRIENLDSNFALLTSKGITDTIGVNEDGTFAKSFSLVKPTYYTFRAGRVSNTIIIIPGSTLTINLDVKNSTDGPQFAGDIAELNSYISNANEVTRNLMKDFRTLYSLSKEDFKLKIDSAKNDVDNLLMNIETTNNEFIALEKARIDYMLKGLLYDYPNYNARITDVEYVFNAEDYSFMSEVDFNSTTHFNIAEYSSLLYKHIQQLHWSILNGDEHKGKSEFERNLMYFDLVDSLITNQTIRDYMKFTSTVETIKWANLEVAKNVADHFIANAETLVYKEIAQSALAKRMLLAPGEPAPEFTLTGIDGNTYSLSDFKGQLVYIDFWATWCGPCLRQIPSLIKLKETYHGKPITFLAISLDDDKDAWVKMVNEDGLKGIQLHADKAWSSDVAQNYQISGIPTFVLIDGEGKLIEYNSPRPSDPEITLLFDKHLKLL
jgi:thiol-disulfide isomerase/thioredoxin